MGFSKKHYVFHNTAHLLYGWFPVVDILWPKLLFFFCVHIWWHWDTHEQPKRLASLGAIYIWIALKSKPFACRFVILRIGRQLLIRQWNYIQLKKPLALAFIDWFGDWVWACLAFRLGLLIYCCGNIKRIFALSSAVSLASTSISTMSSSFILTRTPVWAVPACPWIDEEVECMWSGSFLCGCHSTETPVSTLSHYVTILAILLTAAGSVLASSTDMLELFLLFGYSNKFAAAPFEYIRLTLNTPIHYSYVWWECVHIKDNESVGLPHGTIAGSLRAPASMQWNFVAWTGRLRSLVCGCVARAL